MPPKHVATTDLRRVGGQSASSEPDAVTKTSFTTPTPKRLLRHHRSTWHGVDPPLARCIGTALVNSESKR